MKLNLSLVLTVLFLACSNGPESTSIKEIKSLEQNKKLAVSDSMINTYLHFADAYPEHDSAVRFLFKAGEVCVDMNKLAKGARIYERVAVEYKDNKLAPEALIRAGVLLASMQDAANAKRLYDLFIVNYPNHPRIEEVKLWSETSGMSEERLMERFMEKLKEQDSTLN